MIFLEKIREQDLSRVHKIQKSLFKKLYAKYKDETSPFNESECSLIKKYNRPTDHFLFIKKNEDVLGYIRIVINEDQTKARIAPIGIVPQSEGKG